MQVERTTPFVRDRRAGWQQSLDVLRVAKEAGARVTKTSIMLGCGETPQEVVQALQVRLFLMVPTGTRTVGRVITWRDGEKEACA